MSIVRTLLGVAILFFVGMLYWSSQLLEKEVKELRQEISRLEHMEVRTVVARTAQSTLADPTNPNLLVEDLFVKNTLPQLLGASFVPGGTRVIDDVGKPQNLHPFVGWANVGALWSRCTVAVGGLCFGKYEELSQNAAHKMELRNGNEFWVHLRDDLSWQPLSPSFFPDGFELAPHFLKKHQVTAHDFKFYFDAIMNPHGSNRKGAALRNYFGEIEEFRVIDDVTFVVRWKTDDQGRIKYAARQLTASLQPLPGWVYQYFADGSKIIDTDDYRHNSIWAQNFQEHWAKNVIPSCGPWCFAGWNDEEIVLVRNRDYFERYGALFDRLVIQFRGSPDTVWQDFKANKVDSFESSFAPDKLLELPQFLESDLYQTQAARGAAIEQVEYLDRAFRYIGWNQLRPYFKSKRVRQALTMAIDRQRIIAKVLGGRGIEITGPLHPSDPAYNPVLNPYPYDPLEARRILTEEGWIDHDGDGILDKEIDGQRTKFSFKLVYYGQSSTSRVMCEMIATSLKEVGIDCRPVGMDVADLAIAGESKDFDACSMGWGMGTPPSEPKQLWHSSGAHEKGSSNLVCFENVEVDQLIDELMYEYDPDKRNALYHRFHEIIHEEQPYTFLYVPKTAFLYRAYLENVFIPAERQDLVPGAVVNEPISSIFYYEQ